MPTVWLNRSKVFDSHARMKGSANKLTANNSDWLSRAILKLFYYPQSHLAQTLTLSPNHDDEISDEIIVTKPLVRGQFVCGQLTWLANEEALSIEEISQTIIKMQRKHLNSERYERHG